MNRKYGKKRQSGYVTKGYPTKKKREVFHSAMVSTLPRVGSKNLKFFETYAAAQRSNASSGTGYDYTGDFKYDIFQPITDTLVTEGIVQGVTAHQRIGQRIRLKKLAIRLRAGWPGFRGVAEDEYPQGKMKLRFMIVLDTQPNQAALTDAADVLDSDAGDNVAMPLALINMSNYRRFKILKDELHTIQAQQSGIDAFQNELTVQASYTTVSCDLPLDITTLYSADATDGTAADVVKNNIYIIIGFGQNEGLGDNTPNAFKFYREMKTRLYYTD